MAPPLTGQVAITGSAQRLDPNQTANGCAAFTLKCPATNTNTVYIGGSGVTTGSGYPLTPGDEFEYQKQALNPFPTLQASPSDFYAIGTAGSDVLAWLASA